MKPKSNLKNSSSKECLQELFKAAEAVVATLKNSPEPVIYVGAATCGRAAGALETITGFEEALRDNGIKAEIRRVGCLGHCYAEPLVIIQNPGFPSLLYQKIGAGEAGILVRSFLKDGSDPCYEYLIGALEADENFPTLMDYPRYLYENRVVMEHCGLIDPDEIDHYLAVGGYKSLAVGLEKVVPGFWMKLKRQICAVAAVPVFRPAGSGRLREILKPLLKWLSVMVMRVIPEPTWIVLCWRVIHIRFWRVWHLPHLRLEPKKLCSISGPNIRWRLQLWSRRLPRLKLKIYLASIF